MEWGRRKAWAPSRELVRRMAWVLRRVSVPHTASGRSGTALHLTQTRRADWGTRSQQEWELHSQYRVLAHQTRRKWLRAFAGKHRESAAHCKASRPENS